MDFGASFKDLHVWSFEIIKCMPQVANFEYIDEAELAAEEEAPAIPAEFKAPLNNPERASYWEDLLRDKYEVQKIEEFNAMGKGKRSRKQVLIWNVNSLELLADKRLQYEIIWNN